MLHPGVKGQAAKDNKLPALTDGLSEPLSSGASSPRSVRVFPRRSRLHDCGLSRRQLLLPSAVTRYVTALLCKPVSLHLLLLTQQLRLVGSSLRAATAACLRSASLCDEPLEAQSKPNNHSPLLVQVPLSSHSPSLLSEELSVLELPLLLELYRPQTPSLLRAGCGLNSACELSMPTVRVSATGVSDEPRARSRDICVTSRTKPPLCAR